MDGSLYWPGGDTEMAQRIRKFDWASTSLGPVEKWPAELKTAAAFVIDNRFPAALVWGPEYITIYNDGFRPILGDKPEALGRSFAEIWSEAWDELSPLVEQAFAGESTFIEDFELQIDRTGEPEQAFFTFSFCPVRTADGAVRGMIDTVIETTVAVRRGQALTESESRLKGLLAELQHRVRNTLAVVKSITTRTGEASSSVKDMSAHLIGRLDAFARVQSAVARNPEAGVDLAMIVMDELAAHAIREGKQLSIDGPSVKLQSRAAETISIAMHELATNAVKHGPFGGETGSLDVSWRIDGNGSGRMLHFEWTEDGLDGELTKPKRRGFGMELLTRTLPYDLDAKTDVLFEGTGLRFRMDLPIEHGWSGGGRSLNTQLLESATGRHQP